MAAALDPPEEDSFIACASRPSGPAISETSTASPSPGSRALPHDDSGTPASPVTSKQNQPVLFTAGRPSSRAGSHSEAENSLPTGIAKSPVKRKPIGTAVDLRLPIEDANRDSLSVALPLPLPKPEHRYSTSDSVNDSPTLYNFDGSARPASSTYSSVAPGRRDSSDQRSSALVAQPVPPTSRALSEDRNIPSNHPAASQTPAQSKHAELTAAVNPHANHDATSLHVEELSDNTNSNAPNIMSLFVRKAAPPNLSLAQLDTSLRVTTSQTTTTTTDKTDLLNKPLPKSPASSKLGTFFGWTSSSPSGADPSDKSFSPLPSPFSPKPRTASTDESSALTADSHATNTHALEQSPLEYCEAYLQTPPATATSTSSPAVQIGEMEDELKAISAELASSIRREMDLEDLVDRLQGEINNPQAPGKRTSDYFSDSGYSSAKFSDYDASKEEVAQVQRRAEQEQARIRLELTDKLQDERSKRLLLDRQIKELAAKASQVDTARLQNQDVGGRVKALETTCEDLRRRLAEERQVKGNFEELLSALKGELQNAANERDNLRDEIVPQLRARVEGLEAQANEYAKLTYDSTKLQQEVQSLKTENTNLRRSRTVETLTRSARSNSTTGAASKYQPPSTSGGQNESREALADRLKDVEAQRDALHNALKNLLERQEFQLKENEKKIKFLETERDRLVASSPGKSGYEKDISNLRQEINVLRRRAEEAFEQKWQVEKGLTGLKMDLDRAEQEIADLRSLLKTKDVLGAGSAFPRSSSSSSDSRSASPVSSASLEKSYKDLQLAYREALARMKGGGGSRDEKTELALKKLEQAVSSALSERDAAQREASSYKSKLGSFQSSETGHLKSERELADQLRDSARRVEELAQQVRDQLATNATLRERLSQTVARGEAEQRANEDRITGLQGRLKTLEDQLVAAQSTAEDRVARHEAEITSLKDAHSAQVQRLRDASGALRPSSRGGLLSPNSAAGSSNGGSPLASPRLSPTRPGFRRSVTEQEAAAAAQVETLRARVTELEGALASADAEMQEVVSRMNKAQIEVMTLQEEREQAVRETRKLQRAIEEEKVKAFEERFKTITTTVR